MYHIKVSGGRSCGSDEDARRVRSCLHTLSFSSNERLVSLPLLRRLVRCTVAQRSKIDLLRGKWRNRPRANFHPPSSRHGQDGSCMTSHKACTATSSWHIDKPQPHASQKDNECGGTVKRILTEPRMERGNCPVCQCLGGGTASAEPQTLESIVLKVHSGHGPTCSEDVYISTPLPLYSMIILQYRKLPKTSISLSQHFPGIVTSVTQHHGSPGNSRESCT